ncbi:uncharacterized protein LOC100679292 [Nasonia vitripennis]|uniref:Uncharacterized protein n=1 Tax=Nasonia vitripennis TaxID=7425 RepID=A0A7M7GL42_NASVI|nr:uncharacterized protein LOC100679292 [Nasonia vitripennis]
MTRRTTWLMLGVAVLGLLCVGLPDALANAGNSAASASLNDGNGNGRCNFPPCTCDQYVRLTCDCKDSPEVLLLTSEGERGLGRQTSRILVQDCPSVSLANLSLADMQELEMVEFVNVANLTLVPHSLKLAQKTLSTRISLRNVSLELLPSNVFHGDIEAIAFENVRIGQVAAFAFANLVGTNSITLDHCRVGAMQALAFKKFDVRFLHIIGGSLGGELTSRVMNDIEVYDKFLLDGVRLGAVRSSAFIIRRTKTVAIQNCLIDSLESEAFDIGVRYTVLIKNNSLGSVAFGAFLSIRADAESRPAQPGLLSLTFENNSLTSFEEGSLIFDRTSFRAELSNVLVNQLCECAQLALWKSQILNYTSAHSRLTTARDSTNLVAAPFPLESSAEDPATFLCLLERDSRTSASFADFEMRHCALSSSMLLLILALSGLVTAAVVAVCLAVYCCRRRRRDSQKRWISVPTSAPDLVNSKTTKNGLINRDNGSSGGAPVDSRITMVVPDGRLYRETEFHVIVEKAEPLTTEL